MKTFEEYQDGDSVVYFKDGQVYQAYKSIYTSNAFRLKGGLEDIVADISEIRPFLNEPLIPKSEYPPPLSMYGQDQVPDADLAFANMYVGVKD